MQDARAYFSAFPKYPLDDLYRIDKELTSISEENGRRPVILVGFLRGLVGGNPLTFW